MNKKRKFGCHIVMGDPEVAFSMLDAILKGSRERLKLLRESMSLPHVDTIRNLSLEGKLGVALFLRNKMIHKGVIPDIVTHNYLINGSVKLVHSRKRSGL